ncbi:hypothetical protein [Aurantivibrio plasticivorans]
MRALPFCLLIALLAGCSSTPQQTVFEPAVRDEYCSRFFLYRMCAEDFTDNGSVDAVYFEDEREVFLYIEESADVIAKHLAFHPCAQIIDEPLSISSDKLLRFDEDTSYWRETDVKAEIFGHYLRYVDRVSQCNKEKGLITEQESDDSGFDDFDDFEDDEYDYEASSGKVDYADERA